MMGLETESARNLTLLLMVLFENVHVFNSRSETRSIFQTRFFSNPLLIIGTIVAQLIHIGSMYTPGLKDILQVSPVSFNDWLSLLALALTLLLASEGYKLIAKRKKIVS